MEAKRKQNRCRKNDLLDDESKIIGFYVCSYWHLSFRVKKRKTHEFFRRKENKYDRVSIKDIEFDFSKTPTIFDKIDQKFKEYIQYGILYSFTELYGTMKTASLRRDMRQTLQNGQVNFVTLQKRLLVPNDFTLDAIKSAVKWLRRHNYLSKTFNTIYEWEDLKMYIDEAKDEDIKEDNYIIIKP